MADGVPQCVWWNLDQVSEWIEALGFPQYKETLRINLINGRKLICVNASTLPMIGVTDFNHIQIIAKGVRDLLGIDEPDTGRSIALPRHNPIGMFLERKSQTGRQADRLQYSTDKTTYN
ncbi:sterile alpha motif domain-containing protein 15-like [Corticium candelabrum]|uniref:sterile alpha motif domain-containing protein 15-like n=1 Tax=Corticium candelabrum TaxID=121492 RepID=UPI002E256FBC|nr:sterile alpha motif domain-containing protein 15-like [Corticium candelabrum]